MEILPVAVYLLCLATSLVCAALLFRNFRRSGVKLLLWSAMCFTALAASNLFLFLDLVILPDTDLLALRHLSALIAVAVLLYGFIWETD